MAVGAAWAGTIAFFITMINRLYFACVLLPNISKTIWRTVLCSLIATGVGIALGALGILGVENIVTRLLVGGSIIAVTVTAVMLLLSPQLRVELSRVFAFINAAKQGG